MRTAVLVIFLLLMPVISAADNPGPADRQAVRSTPDAARVATTASSPLQINTSRVAVSSGDEVNPNRYISQEPAPMGIADYGIGPGGPYEYATNSSMGYADIVSLSTRNATGDPGMTIQLNVNLEFTVNGKLYVYWIQDVAFIETNSDLIQFEDNIWNFSTSLHTLMSASAVSGDGVTDKYGNDSFYYDVPGDLPGNNISLSLPAAVGLEVDSGVNSSDHPVVDFSFNDGPGWQRYDTVVFLTSGKLTLPGFVVDGFDYNPLGLFYDSELILGGPGGGLQTTDVSSDVRLQLYYSNGDNFEMVSDAYNFGSDTAEGMNGTLSGWGHYPGDGQNIAEVRSGEGTLGRLYDSSQIGTIDVRSSITSGVLYVVNETDPSATPAQYPFIDGNVTVTIFPGEYTIQLYQNGAISDQTNITVVAGQHLSFKTPFGGTSLTLSYSVVGVGSGRQYSIPVLTYVHDGVQQSTVLTTTPVTYPADPGTPWSVTSTLSGSSGTERWQTDQQTDGIVTSSRTIGYEYFSQFLVSAAFALTGGEGTTAAPLLNYTSFGNPLSITLTKEPQLVWIDGGSQYSAPQTLSLSSSSAERWYDPSTTQGIVLSSSSLLFGYRHQFLLVVVDAGISSKWYNSSSTVQVSVPGVSDRAVGYGQRVASYSIDDGSPTTVEPTTGEISIPVTMDSPHELWISSVQQYQVTLDASATGALSSITPPTIAGDDRWYDLGTRVSLVLNGAWGRSADAGERLVSYSLNGVSSSVSTTGPVDVSIDSLSSPENVSGAAVTQYHLGTGSGSVASVTPPAIDGDAGWYDSGTQVVVSYYYSWDNASGRSRDNALSCSTGDGTTVLERSATGTFQVRLTMSTPEEITIGSVAQYTLEISGGHGASLSLASPTGDAFYDAGSTLTATTDYTWGLVDNNTRQSLISFTLDSVTTPVTGEPSGEFMTPLMTVSGPHALAFGAATQYLVWFQFKDSTGTRSITPTSVQVQPQGAPIVAVPATGTWLDNGTHFQIYEVEWEGTDVKPIDQTVYTVNTHLNQTVLDRVYDGRMVVKDYLGLPISGAGVSVTLANGTTIASTTGSDGSVALHEIPLGTYTARVEYLGSSASIDGDAAVDATAQTRLVSSYPVLGIVAVSLAAIMAVSLAVLRNRSRR